MDLDKYYHPRLHQPDCAAALVVIDARQPDVRHVDFRDRKLRIRCLPRHLLRERLEQESGCGCQDSCIRDELPIHF